jgi:hypothetical protein
MRRGRQAGIASLAIGAAPVRARLADAGERKRLWSEFVAVYPGYESYRERAHPRVIPIVILDPRP